MQIIAPKEYKKQPTKEYKITNDRWEFTFKCRLTEADVETVICRKLQEAWFRFFRQVTISQTSWRVKIRDFRVDILVMDNRGGSPLAIIEVKKSWVKQSPWQLEKYKSTWLEVISCVWLEQITTAVNKVHSAQTNRLVLEKASAKKKLKLKKKFWVVKHNQEVPDYINSLEEQLS